MESISIHWIILLLASLGILTVLMLLLTPLYAKNMDKYIQIKKEISTADKGFKKHFSEKKAEIRGNVVKTPDEYRRTLCTMLNKYLLFRRNKSKEMYKSIKEESGIDDLNAELNKDLRDIFKSPWSK